MSSDITVSIIVPVYNTEGYLSRCLESLSGQTLSSIEVICIDDGSSDGSGAIMDSYACEDPRFVSIHQDNHGAAYSRNVGLACAKGRYVLFVDSDDYVAARTCEALVAVAEREDAEIVVFGGKTFPTTPWADGSFAVREVTYRNDSAVALVCEQGSHPLMCNKLYRRDFLVRNNLSFNDGLLLGEDCAFQCVSFPLANTISYIPDKLYYYCVRGDSAVNSANANRDDKAWKHFDTAEYILRQWHKEGFLDRYESLAFSWITMYLYGETSQMTFDERTLLSQKICAILDEYFPRTTSGMLPVGDVERSRYRFFTQARCSAAKRPFFTIVFDSGSRGDVRQDVLCSLQMQTEQRYEVIVPYERGESSPFLRVMRKIASKDMRFTLLPDANAVDVLNAASGDYLIRLHPNEKLSLDALERLATILQDSTKVGALPDLLSLFDNAHMFGTSDLWEAFLPNATTVLPAGSTIPSGEFSDGELLEALTLFPGTKLWSVDFLKSCAATLVEPSWLQLYAIGVLSCSELRLVDDPILNAYCIYLGSTDVAHRVASTIADEYSQLPITLCRHGFSDQVIVSAKRALLKFAVCALGFVQEPDALSACFEVAKEACDANGLFNRVNELHGQFASEARLLQDSTAYDFALAQRSCLAETAADDNMGNRITIRSLSESVQTQNALRMQSEQSLRGQIDELRGTVTRLESSTSLRVGRKVFALPRAVANRFHAARAAVQSARTPAIVPSGSEGLPAVSVVVPVHNVAAYLPECLDSLLAQELDDIEIICVNDGSTDGSLEILLDYAKRDSRITVLSKANRGYGHTMNMGFGAAHGEYVGIVESDDFAAPEMFKELYGFAKVHDCDLVKSNYYEHSEDGDVLIEPFASFDYETVFDPRVYQGPMTALPIIWSAIYKRSMLMDNAVRFNETPGASYQDTSFTHQAWMSARRAAILPKGYLHYRVDNSTSSVKSSSKVYAVCDEYAMSERFMCRDPERERAFAGLLCLLKRGTYWWNFNRIAVEYRRGFALRMRREYMAAERIGWLDESYFDADGWAQIRMLLDDFEGFMDRYEEAGL